MALYCCFRVLSFNFLLLFDIWFVSLLVKYGLREAVELLGFS